MPQFVDQVAKAMAIIGGVVLTALIVLTCVSITGRSLNSLAHSSLVTEFSEGFSSILLGAGVGPVNGDFELVEAGIAFSIFAFLPVTQLYSAHATVDIFTAGLSARVNQIIQTVWELVLTALIILITWRLYAGMMSKMAYGETTFLLQFPIWWAYALSLFAAVVASLVGIYCAIARLIELVSGRKILPVSEETL